MRKPLRRLAGLAACAFAASHSLAAEPNADLVVRAKAEAKLVYYTDLIVDQIVRPLVAAFEAKYGVKVEYSRADSQDTSIKLINEHKAGRMQADVFGLTSGLQSLIDAGAVRKFSPANAAEIRPEFRDPGGYWVSTNYYVMTPAANTDLVAEADRPATFDDLLLPKWKDKLAWKPNDLSGAPGFIANVLRSMGEDAGMAYLRKLSSQGVKSIGGSARAVVDQVIAGEYPVALQIFNHHAALSAAKGAPVQWLKMQPAMVQMTLVTLTTGSKSPNAAQLFVEFMLSAEGQELFRQASYFPTHAGLSPAMPELAPDSGAFKANFFSPQETARGYEKWSKLYLELFR